MKNISTCANGFEIFLNICVSALDNFAPRKKVFTRTQYPFHESNFHVRQVKRARLKNSYLKNKSVEKKTAYNR